MLLGTVFGGGRLAHRRPKVDRHRMRTRLPAACSAAGCRCHFSGRQACAFERLPVVRLEIVSEINLRVLLSQVAEIRSGPQRFAGGELNQLRGKKLASMLMDVFPEPLEQAVRNRHVLSETRGTELRSGPFRRAGRKVGSPANRLGSSQSIHWTNGRPAALPRHHFEERHRAMPSSRNSRLPAGPPERAGFRQARFRARSATEYANCR